MNNEGYKKDTLRLVLDNTPDMVYVLDHDYKYIFKNKALRSRFGDIPQDKCCYEIFEGRQSSCELCSLPELIAQGPGHGRVRQHFNEKLQSWFDINEMCITWSDGQPALLVSAKDITQLKQKDEELAKAQELLLHNSKVMQEISENIASTAMYRTYMDEQGDLHFEYINRMFEQLSGIPLEALYQDMSMLFSRVHPEDRQIFREKVFAQALDFKERIIEFRYILNGKIVWYKIMSCGYIKNDRMIRDGILVDITAEKIRELELLSSIDKAQEAANAKSNFMATISHEIRNPMNAIVGFMELLSTNEGNIDTQTQLEYMRIVSDNANHMLKLIGDILDISKLDSSNMKLAPVMLNLNQLMNDIYASFIVCDSLASKPVELIMDQSGQDGDGIFTLDQSRLRQILNNLINNAIKFTEKGFVSFGYKREQGALRFYVQDTGIGIPQDKIEQLGQPFSQVHDRSLAAKYGGTGLGLAISFNLIKLMGGNVNVSSEPGKGTRFEFTIVPENFM